MSYTGLRYSNRELLQEHLSQFDKDPNTAYDSSFNGKLDSDCATAPAAIEREKITINKSEYDELRKSLTEWQTISSLLDIAPRYYNGRGPAPSDVFAARQQAQKDIEQLQLKLGERIQEIMYKNAEISDLMKQRDVALNDLELLRAEIKALKSKKRKRSK